MDTFHGIYSVNSFHKSVENKSGFAFNKNLDGYEISEIDRPTVFLFISDLGWNQNGTLATLPPTGYMEY